MRGCELGLARAISKNLLNLVPTLDLDMKICSRFRENDSALFEAG